MTPEQLRAAYLSHVANEPPQDAGQHPSMELHEQVGNAWAKWERVRLALWTLLADALADEYVREPTPSVTESTGGTP